MCFWLNNFGLVLHINKYILKHPRTIDVALSLIKYFIPGKNLLSACCKNYWNNCNQCTMIRSLEKPYKKIFFKSEGKRFLYSYCCFQGALVKTHTHTHHNLSAWRQKTSRWNTQFTCALFIVSADEQVLFTRHIHHWLLMHVYTCVHVQERQAGLLTLSHYCLINFFFYHDMIFRNSMVWPVDHSQQW